MTGQIAHDTTESSSLDAGTIREAVRRLLKTGKLSEQQLTAQLGHTLAEMDKLLTDYGEVEVPQALRRLLEEYEVAQEQ